MDPMTRAKHERETADLIENEAVLDLFPVRFQLFGNVPHSDRERLAQRLGFIPAFVA